jgi:rRNA maturation RNase YbeY
MNSGNVARCRAVSSSPPPRKEVAVEVPVVVEGLDDVEVGLEAVIEQLEIDAPLAVKVAIEGFEDFDQSEAVELSVMLCDDARIRELNKEWRGKDSATDVLSFPQDQPAGAPLMLLGDLVISVETAARQAEERGHSLVDELRILLVHGLLHVLDYDHELGPEASEEMEEEENRILSALGWKVKGLIHATSSLAHEAEGKVGKASKVFPLADIDSDGDTALTTSKSKFRILFCDMDGTLLNTKSFVTQKTADALRAAMDAGVTVVIATGKTRPAAMAALAPVGLAGEGGVLSEYTPGVFLQGLQVFGNQGKIIQNIALDSAVVEETFKFSVEHNVALVGFTGDRCVTLFSHPLIDELHEVYYEPKAEVLGSLEELKKVKIQKVIFLDTAEKVASFLRPHWSLALGGRATVVQALPEMMEILPSGVSKGLGVQTLLDHLDVPVDEVMALGDGENDIEMLQLAGWGVSMANGAARTLAVANVITSSNDEDGVARAIEEYIL